MEEDGTDIVEMAVEGEKTFASLVVPDLDFVIIATGYEERLSGMEGDATDGA